MNRMYRSILLSVIFIFSSLLLYSQRFDSLLKKLDARYPQEKLYLQFDRNAYNPGETIWFKAYLFAGNIPSLISRTLYAELIDEKGNVIDRKIAPLLNSSAAASFDLPKAIKDPVLYVRAYTKWMLNFDSSFLYTKAIPIITTASRKEKTSSSKPNAFLQFFPEGGDLVENLQSRVAFKATDGSGLPIAVSGIITDRQGKQVASFSDVHDGMGMFSLVPKPSESYTAIWKDPKGESHKTALPRANKSGVVMEVINSKEGIRFKIRRPSTVESSPFSSVYVVAQWQQQMLYRARADLRSSSEVGGMIPGQNLPSGIIQLTVFTIDEKPLAERIVFFNNQDYYFITDLNAALKDVSKRGRNVIQIDVPDTISCNLSVSVTDASLNPRQPEEEDIFSTVLLTSDIKGYIHNPGYYFSSEADSVAAHLDLVMMTNGWRRFRWEDVMANRWPTIKYLPDAYLSINGQVTGIRKNIMATKELTGIFQTSNGNKQFINIPLDTAGKFVVPGLIFFDTATMYYQFNDDKDKVLTTAATVDFKTDILRQPLTLKTDSASLLRVLQSDTSSFAKNREMGQINNSLTEEENKRVKTLATVEITAKQKSEKQKMDDEYTSGLFRGGDGYTFLTADDPFANSSMSVLNYLQGKVPGLQITVSGSQASLSWRGGSPDLYMNEMKGDVEMIQSISMNDVAMIKVFRPPFFGSFGGGSGGAIAVYTKKGGANNSNVKGLDNAKLVGYSPVKQFYSPDYSKYDAAHEQPDYRPTIYWNPYVLTDKDTRRVLLSFYNNDATKKLRIVIEGVNADGKLTRIEKFFENEK